MRNGLVLASAVVGGFLMVGCTGGGSPLMGDIPAGDEPAEGGIAEVPNPTAEMALKSGKSLEQLQQGHVVYMLKCGECHRYMLPKYVKAEKWQVTIPKMIQHAGLGATDEKAVLNYVLAVKAMEGS